MKRVLFAASASLLLSGCHVGDFGMSYRDSFEESRPLAADGELSLENTNGRVTITAWDEPRVRIEAEKAAGSKRALEELAVVVEGEGDRVEVRTRHPRPRWMGGAGKVDYRIRVPRSARLSVRNVNGRLEVEGVEGRVRASTVNGSLELDGVAGEVEASTTNGSLEASLSRVASGTRSELSTTNGSVRLTLPRDAGAEIEARTVNGAVHCDFELAEKTRSCRRRLEGRIGGGGARFELRTVNGSVNVEKGFSSKEARTPAEAEAGARSR